VPHCLKKNGTPAATHWSRSLAAHAGCIGRAFGPLPGLKDLALGWSVLVMKVLVIEVSPSEHDDPARHGRGQ
jgi:hypothetical protein